MLVLGAGCNTASEISMPLLIALVAINVKMPSIPLLALASVVLVVTPVAMVKVHWVCAGRMLTPVTSKDKVADAVPEPVIPCTLNVLLPHPAAAGLDRPTMEKSGS